MREWPRIAVAPEIIRCEDCGELRALCLCPHEDWIDDADLAV